MKRMTFWDRIADGALWQSDTKKGSLERGTRDVLMQPMLQTTTKKVSSGSIGILCNSIVYQLLVPWLMGFKSTALVIR